MSNSARGARTRLDVEAERGLTPYVGRERELAILAGCFEKARARHGQVVFVVGAPGIAKSQPAQPHAGRLESLKSAKSLI